MAPNTAAEHVESPEAIKAPAELARPNASIVFDATEWLIYTRMAGLTLQQQGRLMTQILRAVDERDEAFLAQHSAYVKRVYWRDHPEADRPAISANLRKAVLERDGTACVLCGCEDRIELDHIVPWSKGGRHSLDNLRVLCKPCNRRKGARTP